MREELCRTPEPLLSTLRVSVEVCVLSLKLSPCMLLFRLLSVLNLVHIVFNMFPQGISFRQLFQDVVSVCGVLVITRRAQAYTYQHAPCLQECALTCPQAFVSSQSPSDLHPRSSCSNQRRLWRLACRSIAWVRADFSLRCRSL